MEWRTLNIFDNRFIISEYGNVINTITNHELSPYINNSGYYMIDLSCNCKRERYLLHRLVATAFVSNPNNYPIVLHKDNNPLNIHYSNLVWGTYSENNAQAIRDGLNVVPKPDNSRLYEIYNDKDSIICCGIKEVIEEIGFGNDSSIRNYIFRQTPIREGKYKGYYIKRSNLSHHISFTKFYNQKFM